MKEIINYVRGYRCCGSSIAHHIFKEGRSVVEKRYVITSKDTEYFCLNKQNWQDLELMRYQYKKARIFLIVLTNNKAYMLTYEQIKEEIIRAIEENDIIPIHRNKTIVLWKIPFNREWEIELDEELRKMYLDAINEADKKAHVIAEIVRNRKMKYAKSGIFLNNLKNEGS